MRALLRPVIAGARGARAAPRGARTYAALREWATIDPATWNGSKPYTVQNLVSGEWKGSATTETVIDPLNGDAFLRVPATGPAELGPFIANVQATPKSGLHNPIKNVDRYLMLGRVADRAAACLHDAEISDFLAKLIMRTSPKSYAQALGEVKVCAAFLDNFSGDNVRYLARSFGNPGDRDGQESRGYRFPFGGVALVTPFNFPIEIPLLQVFGALFMGNRPTLKVDSKVSVVMEQVMRMLHAVGLPRGDVDMINCDGPTMNRFLVKARPRSTLFTGSSRVAEKLSRELSGRIRIEDAGFDWKVLGPDASAGALDYVAWQSDQDAYACSGQKCSAQSILFAHRNWARLGLYERLAALAARRNLADLTIGPVLTWTTERMLAHVNALLEIPGAKLLFGGKPLTGHSIPAVYGAIEPTAVFVPLRKLAAPRHFQLATTEVFGPLQVVTEFRDKDLPIVLGCLERMTEHLTAAVVSNDDAFRLAVLGATTNGTTYAGIRARTTGAPQNHWFGPSGDPRGAGIGTREAILHVWSAHREIIADVAPIAADWKTPVPS